MPLRVEAAEAAVGVGGGIGATAGVRLLDLLRDRRELRGECAVHVRRSDGRLVLVRMRLGPRQVLLDGVIVVQDDGVLASGVRQGQVGQRRPDAALIELEDLGKHVDC